MIDVLDLEEETGGMRFLSVSLLLGLYFSTIVYSNSHAQISAEPADTSATPTPTPGKGSDDEMKTSFAPLAGYDPTYSVFAGVGFFTEKKEKLKTSLLLIYTFKNVYRIEPGFNWKLNDQYSIVGEYQLNNGFEPFYGINNNNSVTDEVDVFGYEAVTRTGLKRSYNKQLSTTYSIPYFFWTPAHSKNDQVKKRLLPQQTNIGFEVKNLYDQSFKKARISEGWSVSNDTKYFFNPSPILRSEFSFRYFVPTSTDSGFGFHTLGGVSFGNRKYFDLFSLGGTDRLRGFLKNRYVGGQFVLQQTEFRFPTFIKSIGAVTFADFGEVFNASESPFLKLSAGFGLRYSLPPDHIEVIRIDAGFAKDQWGVFFDFGQSF